MRYIVHCQIYCRYCGYSVVDVADMFCKCCRYWAVTDRWRHESHISALCTRKISHFLQYIQPHQGDAHPPPPSPPALPPRCGLVPSGTRRAWCADSPFRGLRLARPPLRYASGVLPPLRTPVTDCPHAPRLRPSPPSRSPPSTPPSGGSGRRPPTLVSPAMTPIGRLGGV